MQPFEGLRVLDFTHVLAGPFAAYQLSVLGADVIKIESPHSPDMMRGQGADSELSARGLGTGFVCQNAGKRSLVLDLSRPEGRAVALRLVEGADVLLENYRKGKLEALGLGYDAVAAVRPDIVYCSLTGFGLTGPKAEHPAYDPVIQAYSGLMAANGNEAMNPLRVGPPLIDYGTGAQAAFAISAALFQRTRTGKGQRIDIAMADAALMMMSMPIMATQSLGKTPPPFGSVTPGQPGYSCHDTADGLIFLGAATNRQVAELWRALGQAEIADAREAMSDSERAELAEHDREHMSRILAGQTAEMWEGLLNEAGVPAARVRRMDEALAEAQMATRGVLATSELTSNGKTLSLPVAAFGYDHGGPALAGPVPRHGEHSREVLLDAGFEAGEVDALVASGTVGTA